MKKTITLFIEGFIEGWNGTSGKLTGNPPPPKATAARFDACTHLTAEELDTVFRCWPSHHVLQHATNPRSRHHRRRMRPALPMCWMRRN